jgi:UDP-perosamine 4-acetyltransferase
MKPILIFGSGGHAKVVIDLINTIGEYDIVGCLSFETGSVEGIPIIGTDEDADRILRRSPIAIAVALGSNKLRLRIGREFVAKGAIAPPLIHPKAIVASSATIGSGTVIMAGAVVNPAAHIGDFVIVNTLAGIDHDCVLGDGAHIAPNATLAGNVSIGARVFMGVGSCARPGTTIGDDTIIGAGGVVAGDIGPDKIAVGIPARPRGQFEQ